MKKGEEGKSNELRVSVALAMVKVIMKLPKKYSDNLIPGVLAEVGGVMTSKLQDVRDDSRNTLVKIMAGKARFDIHWHGYTSNHLCIVS